MPSILPLQQNQIHFKHQFNCHNHNNCYLSPSIKTYESSLWSSGLRTVSKQYRDQIKSKFNTPDNKIGGQEKKFKPRVYPCSMNSFKHLPIRPPFLLLVLCIVYGSRDIIIDDSNEEQ
jgi:hypothetical protein